MGRYTGIGCVLEPVRKSVARSGTDWTYRTRSGTHREFSYALLAFMLLFSGCTESDVVTVRIQLNSDLSGTVSTSSLLIPPEGGPLERGSSGVEWGSRVGLIFSAGRFQHLSKLRIEDITFTGGVTPDGLSYLRVTLPRGAAARWAKALVPLSKAEREKAALAFDTGGRVKNVGSSIKLRMDLPGPVVAHGVSSSARGSAETAEKQRAELLVPLEVAESSGDALQWHITWQREVKQ